PVGTLTGGPPTVFNGKVFVRNASHLFALHALTGAVAWVSRLNGTPIGFGPSRVFKVDDTYLGYICSDRITFHRIDNGAWVSTTMITAAMGISTLVAGEVLYWGAFYYREYKLALCAARNLTTNQHMAVAFDCSNPAAGVRIKWRCPLPTGVEALGGSGGLAFYGGYGEGELYAINATTGKLVWRSWKVGDCGYSITYYDGKVYHSGGSTRVTCYDPKNGAKLWDFDCGPRAFFAFGGAAAYGLYFDKCMAIPGFVAAWDAKTGEMVWKQPAHYYITYGVPAVADGKLYVHTCDQAAGSSVAGVTSPGFSFTCFDAFTGQVIWRIPINIAYPSIAYGNVYGISGGTLYCIGERTDPWSTFEGRPGNYRIAVGQSAPSDISCPWWSFQTGGPIVGSPVVADGKVYVGSYDGNIYCIDAFKGTLIWKFPIGYRVSSTPAVVGGRVYTGADDGYVYCIDATTGAQIWKKPAGGVSEGALFRSIPQRRSSPMVVGDRIYVGAMDGRVYCFDTDGNQRWVYTATNLTYGIGGSPYVYKGVVYIASGNGVLHAINATTGRGIWNRTITASDRRFVATPIVVNDRRAGEILIIGSDTGAFMGGRRMTIVDPATGSVITHVSLTLVGTASIVMSWQPAYMFNGTHGILYISENMYVSAWAIVNRTYYTRIWSQWVGHAIYSSAVFADDITGAKVYVGNNAYSLICFDAGTGKPLSSYSTGGQIYGSAALYAGNVYVGSYDGRLYCFRSTPVASTNIVAWCDWKECNVNETIIVQGKLRAVTVYDVKKFNPRFPTNYSETWYPGIPNATVTVTFVKPDGTTVDVKTKTDRNGMFKISFKPTASGDWKWTAWFEGEDRVSHVYDCTYTDEVPLKVKAPVTEQPPQQTAPTALPMEYMYAIVAVIIVILVVVLAAYLTKKKAKK
ncbi:MAG: PQQ-binding-like beta-propeller repeat protein, partial [Nitrososphaerota archaeon]|nr:PQQ-binding-like beta-propeller repeat protein [Nitrososphaerota archaeon]